METRLLADRYELRGVIGEGGMARVHEGFDRILARRVAIKLLREDLAGGRAVRERMLREARTAASFHHPNAVAVFDTGQDGRTPYIVMELVEGGTLADEIAERGALDVDRARAVALDVLAALAAAHDRGLVHRDVKPANIMLPPGEGAKLADFGIAKGAEEVAGLTVDGQVLGTPKYLSPEQVGGQAATVRSDVYAMGVVLYEMLAGEPPFTNDNPFAVAVAHQEDDPPRLDRRVKGVDRGLVQVVHRCLEKDPARRFSNARELRRALQEGYAGVPPAAATTVALGTAGAATTAPADPRPGATASARGRGVGFAAALLVLLVLASFLAFQMLNDGATDDPGEQDPVEGIPDGEAPDEAVPEPTPDPAESPPPSEPGTGEWEQQPDPGPGTEPEDPDVDPTPEPPVDESLAPGGASGI